MENWENTLRPALVKRATLMANAYLQNPSFPEPEDFAQEVLLKLWKRYGGEMLGNLEPRRLFGLAYQVLKNSIVDEIRKFVTRKESAYSSGEEHEVNSVLERIPGREESPDEAVARSEMSDVLRARLAEELDNNEARFLLLSFELDSAAKAQKECGWPPGTPNADTLCHLRRRLLKRVMRRFAEQSDVGPPQPRHKRK